MFNRNRAQIMLHVGLTAVLVGYFLVWLPHPVVGLRFIGLDVGEWVKFLPQVRAEEIGLSRDWFYLPPITLGLALALLTARWSNGRWQTWVVRGLAVLVTLLAFPAIEAIRGDTPDNYLFRLQMIGVVAIVSLLSSMGQRLPPAIPWLLLALVGLFGALMPTWVYMVMRPVAEAVMQRSVGIGPGVWLNLGGHLLVTAVGLFHFSHLITLRRHLVSDI